MIDVVLYKDINEVYSLNFITSDEDILVICPNPTTADDVREKISQNNSSIRINVITISRFVADEFQEYINQGNVYRKSQLLLQLSTAWKMNFPDSTFESFLQTYEIFTDLRSYTLNLDLVDEILDEFSAEIAHGIRIFWKLLEHLQIYDEQSAYFQLSEYYREITHDETLKRNIVFHGFSHLSASQIDLFNSLSIVNNVFVPFSESVFSKARFTDWIKWMAPDKVSSVETNPEIPVLSVVDFQKGRLAESLNNLKVSKNSFKANRLVLAQKNPSLDHLMEIPLNDIFFKVKAGIFSGACASAIRHIKEFVSKQDGQKALTEDLVKHVNNKLKDLLNFGEQEEDFKAIKVFTELKTLIVEWEDLSESNNKVSLFDLKIFERLLDLQMPRNYFGVLLEKDPEVIATGLEALDSVKDGDNVIFVVNSNHTGISTNEENYSEDMARFLSAVGPVKRKGFENEILLEKIKSLLTRTNCLLMLENGILDASPFWSELFEKFSLKSVTLESGLTRDPVVTQRSTKRKPADPAVFEKLSASRIQTYIDCPMKFYFSYIEKYEHDIDSNISIPVRDMGTLQHEVIDEYFKKFREWNSKEHQKICNELFEKYLNKKKLGISDLDFQKAIIEIIDYSQNGISFILNFIEQDPDLEIEFEYKIENEIHGGSIDCIIKTKNGIFILDFKRSGSSIPTKSEFLSFEKIQLWYYLHNFEHGKKVVATGYLNLSEPSESLFFLDSLAQEISEFEIFESTAKTYRTNLLEEGLVAFNVELGKHLEIMIKDKEFKANPRNNGVCTWCWMKNICTKGKNQ